MVYWLFLVTKNGKNGNCYHDRIATVIDNDGKKVYNRHYGIVIIVVVDNNW